MKLMKRCVRYAGVRNIIKKESRNYVCDIKECVCGIVDCAIGTCRCWCVVVLPGAEVV
jgi:hypothetical protein